MQHIEDMKSMMCKLNTRINVANVLREGLGSRVHGLIKQKMDSRMEKRKMRWTLLSCMGFEALKALW